MILLAIWLVLTGLMSFVAMPMPAMLMAVLALLAGVLILSGSSGPGARQARCHR
jgi:hypothetical protein